MHMQGYHHCRVSGESNDMQLTYMSEEDVSSTTRTLNHNVTRQQPYHCTKACSLNMLLQQPI